MCRSSWLSSMTARSLMMSTLMWWIPSITAPSRTLSTKMRWTRRYKLTLEHLITCRMMPWSNLTNSKSKMIPNSKRSQPKATPRWLATSQGSWMKARSQKCQNLQMKKLPPIIHHRWASRYTEWRFSVRRLPLKPTAKKTARARGRKRIITATKDKVHTVSWRCPSALWNCEMKTLSKSKYSNKKTMSRKWAITFNILWISSSNSTPRGSWCHACIPCLVSGSLWRFKLVKGQRRLRRCWTQRQSPIEMPRCQSRITCWFSMGRSEGRSEITWMNFLSKTVPFWSTNRPQPKPRWCISIPVITAVA